MTGRSKATTHPEYLADLPDGRREEIARIDAFIRRHIPKSWDRWMVAGMMGYGRYRYKTKAGKEGEWFRVGLASNKAYVSLYICATDNGKYLAESYKKKLPKASIGKSCVRFKSFDDLDPKVVAQLLKSAAKVGFGM